MNDTQPNLSVEHIEELADDLIRELTPHVGNPDAVTGVLNHWLDVLDVPTLPLVCTAALHAVFADCLFRWPAANVPTGHIALKTEGEAA